MWEAVTALGQKAFGGERKLAVEGRLCPSDDAGHNVPVFVYGHGSVISAMQHLFQARVCLHDELCCWSALVKSFTLGCDSGMSCSLSLINYSKD